MPTPKFRERSLSLRNISLEWKANFEASEKDILPKDLLCGVLSEDGIDHALEENRELMARCGRKEARPEEDH